MLSRERRRQALLLASLVCVTSIGCSAILGFEEFSDTPVQGGGGGEEGGDGDGQGTACEKENECTGQLLCVNGKCTDSCEAGAVFCAGEALYTCNDDGDGTVGEGDDCASDGLCQQAVGEDLDACPVPLCEEGESRCVGGESYLEGEKCSEDRTGFELEEDCKALGWQCNPGTASCFRLQIDETEVSRADYRAFLGKNVDPKTQASACQWNDDFSAAPDCMGSSTVCAGDDCDEHPQVCVDWCDAVAYCEFQNQRLCGTVGSEESSKGALVDFDEAYRDAGSSEWMNACSAGGQTIFTSGNDAPAKDDQSCTFAGRINTTYEVGSHKDCSSPAPGYTELMDLSGNVAEWTNNCDGSIDAEGDGAGVACRVRGGSFESQLSEIECAAVTAIAQRRADVAPTIGFRCCD